MGTGLLSTERTAIVPAYRATRCDLVLPVSSARSERAAPTDARVGGCKTQVRVRASAYLADPRGLASRAEQGSPAVQAGGPPGAYESTSQEAHQSAPRAGATGDGSGAILGNGFRTRRADERKEISSIDRDRQVASPVCRATSGLCANWAKCRGRTERSSLRTRSTVFDNCRSWNGIYIKKILDEWCYFRGLKLDFIRPGKPTENGMIESFNGRLRDECLNVNEFATLDEVRTVLKAWRHDYNHCRPHGSLGNLTPSEYGSRRSENDPEAPNSNFK